MGEIGFKGLTHTGANVRHRSDVKTQHPRAWLIIHVPSIAWRIRKRPCP